MGETATEPSRESNSPQRSESEEGAEPRKALASGTPAPDFMLHTTPDQTVSLSDFRGQPVILAFYPADWSPVCSDEMALFNEMLPEFRRHRAELLGISVDGVWRHLAFARDRHLRFPLLSDFEPKVEPRIIADWDRSNSRKEPGRCQDSRRQSIRHATTYKGTQMLH